jgi:hypothetical protein
MCAKQQQTVSLANTPVRRALARSRRSWLILLFLGGLVGGLLVKNYLGYNPLTEEKPQQVQQQQ